MKENVFSLQLSVIRKVTTCLILLVTFHLLLVTALAGASLTSVHAQGFNVASSHEITDKEAVSGDILIYDGANGLVRTNVTYSQKIFGVYTETPSLVIREASASAKPIIRLGDVDVNVTDYNGEIKKGDYVTTSPVSGKGMKAGQSGYVLGLALADAVYGDQTVTAEGGNYRLGTVNTALRIEYAELTTARSNIKLLSDLNAAFFRSVQDPEKFTLTIRYIIAGLVALLAFAIGFFYLARSISKAVEAIGRNPLARTAIITSVGLQVAATLIGGVVTIGIIFIIVRI
ncbi:MAG: hypothetical protein ACD_30C00114G0006 [uncultured bacterium]|uniref:Uncharacterized protein n=2 Tax=Candidatus Daviesiibacteriota TaxID=1752718 RepID=A0A1F5K0F8_9BACT|nr:MAG: hypothetical protein ACD_30C00114G0006 [uncultured bacterium]KKQ14536.1 MAG: hypothetical protein US28_C0034G0009 [Candidatus Daviesbacteria bacterium GW2011_GWA1_36_8]OGE34399.1 MAG: hypothetical protein A3E66_02475 [Candidatus Daviesbacteria bacterium RIFCSPHIGHO2_12_FULL_37_16]